MQKKNPRESMVYINSYYLFKVLPNNQENKKQYRDNIKTKML